MSEAKKPAWMQDDLVKEIPPEKLEFLGQMFTETKGKSQKELMTMLIPLMKKAKQEKLTFSQEEMNAAISSIRKHSSTEELQQIDRILQKGGRK